ncbi:MAG: ABC transporter ATP-binding protein [Polaromonas sp.]|nr:ABC transporter ATP-binding protein [Polaromonas sp.]
MPSVLSPSDPTPIQLDHVRLLRGTTTVFDGLTLRLNESRIGLIGDNGAGKSSLFRLICGLDKPQSGSVTVWGHDAQSKPAERVGLVGMMFQNPDDQIIFPTVEEELALSLSTNGLSRKVNCLQARQVLTARGLGHWAERAIGSLSQGQRQHVCWLALMMASPKSVLLDEPFSSLDLPGRAMLDLEIAKASQQVIVSTHLLDHVRGFERVIWLDKGQVRSDSDGASVCATYEADVAVRCQSPSMRID